MTNGAWSKIAVVGAGAVGSYFGAVLAQAGNNVTLIGRQSHIDAINRDGLLFQDQSAERRVEVSATTDIAAVSGAGLVLFCVKSLDTEQAAKQMAPHLAPRCRHPQPAERRRQRRTHPAARPRTG